MNGNNFLSNFGPPPQPKILKIDPPKHTVPDVTLLFDSNDSYLWKADAGRKNILESPKNMIASPKTKLSTLSNKENIPVVKAFSDHCTLPSYIKISKDSNLDHKAQNSSPYPTNKIIYDPEVYRSPILCKENKISDFASDNESKNCKGQSQDMLLKQCFFKNMNPSVETNLNVGIKLNEIQKDILKSGTSYLKSPIKYHCYNQNHFYEDTESLKDKRNLQESGTILSKEQKVRDNLYEEQNKISPASENSNLLLMEQAVNDIAPKRKIDKHVLKVLEEQKLQISQLQNIVEKVLKQQTKVVDSDVKFANSINQCFCNHIQSATNELDNRKIAIVQTSLIDNKIETRTISTNTDLTMNDISSLLDLKTKFNEKQYGIRRNNSLRTNHKNSIIVTPKRDLLQSKKGNGDHYLEEKLDGYYLKETSENIPSNDFIAEDSKEFCQIEMEANEHPFFGASAKILQQRFTDEEDSSEVLYKDEINNLTCYNNIQINIQQKILQQREQANEPKEENVDSANIDPSVQEVEQQLQNFGISFLDPITLRNREDDRHRPELPSPFSFYPNYPLEAGLGSNERAVFSYKNQESPMRNWRNMQLMLNKKYINPNREENSVYSSSTIQFIRKYGLRE